MSEAMTQAEFDRSDRLTIHLLTEDRQHALCSGERVEPELWDNPANGYKFCEACRLASRRQLRGY